MSNIGFVGKEGFNWWLGQIPSVNTSDTDSGDNSWALQADGKGWGDRYKVRILGYHPAEESELSNNDLPYALAMLPSTSGTGAASYSQSTRLRPGDTVVGFFMDGASAQIPVIMGALTRTADVSTGNVTSFGGGTGHNKNASGPDTGIKKTDTNLHSETGGQGQNAQVCPANTKETAESEATGQTITFANTCEDNFFTEVNSLLDNLLNVVGETTNFLGDVQNTIKKIQNLSNGFVGTLFDSLYNELIPLLQDGLDKLYKSVFDTVLAATGNEFSAHLAGVAAQEGMVPAVNGLQDGLICVAAKIVNGLGDTIKELVESTVVEVVNFGICTAEQFVGALLNDIIDDISSGLDAALGAVSKILTPAFQVADFLRSTSDVLKAVEEFLNCNQTSSCKKNTKLWTIGYGPKNRESTLGAIDNALNNANVANALSGISSGTSPYTKPDCGEPSSCGGPTVTFFGGNGVGGAGEAILGGVVNNTEGLDDVVSSVQNTGSIIGVEITDPGSGYTYAPPIVTFEDSCDLGYGAVGKAIVDYDSDSPTYGQITGVYMLSEGENYPVEGYQENMVTGTVVLYSGNGYLPEDTATDDAGTEYNLTVDKGRIIAAAPINNVIVDTLPVITINTNTGIGAVIRPLVGRFVPPQQEVIQVIDCVS